MNWIKRLLYKKDGNPTLVGKPVSRIIGPKKKQYRAHCLLKYKGNPIRKFEVTQKAYSRDQAKGMLEEGLEVTVASIYRDKKKR